MKYIMPVFVVLTMIACKQKENKKTDEKLGAKQETKTENKQSLFYVGTYTEGDSEGIYTYYLSEDGKLAKNKLVATSQNPSFLTFSHDRKYLLAVNEIKNKEGQGTVSSYQVEKDTLVHINKVQSGGAHPCFVAVNVNNYVLTANYSSGNVGLLKLNNEGKLSGLLNVHQHKGKGVHERQDAPHAHSVWFHPTQKDVIEVDLGTNQLWFSQIDAAENKLKPKSPEVLGMEPGAGPRHMTFHPNGEWAYVLNELNSTITILMESKESYSVMGNVATLPEDFKEENTGADIHISSDGKFLYASNRGHNSIAIFKVEEDGTLTKAGHEPVRGEGPRNFILTPNGKHLLVANQYTNNIVSFQRDSETGLLTFVDEIDAPTPVCLLF